MRDPISLALFGDEQVEWRASPNWDLAEYPLRRKALFRLMLFLTFITSLASGALVVGSPSLKDGSPDRPMATAVMLIAFTITGYAWLHLARQFFSLPVNRVFSQKALYALTDKKLIVIPEDQSLLAIKAADYQLTSASVRPNGLVNDLELFFERRDIIKRGKQSLGPVSLHAIDNAETIKEIIARLFSEKQPTLNPVEI